MFTLQDRWLLVKAGQLALLFGVVILVIILVLTLLSVGGGAPFSGGSIFIRILAILLLF